VAGKIENMGMQSFGTQIAYSLKGNTSNSLIWPEKVLKGGKTGLWRIDYRLETHFEFWKT